MSTSTNLHHLPKEVISIIPLVLTLMTILLYTPIHRLSAQEIPSKLELVWAEVGQEGVARATCASGLAVYTVGYDAKGKVGAVEARDVNTGQLLGVWKAGYYSTFHDCVVLGDYL
jgi:hypothetical protein